jgi:branched-chain amino acid transport system ATP-binding protein
VRALTKRFRGLVAVSQVSFSVAPGQILGLIGPNGAGKTTLVSLISGTLAPTLGEIHFEGRRIDHLPPYRRAHLGIGRTFQVMKPFPGLSVLDNVAVGALFGLAGGERDRSRARDRARQCLELTGLDPRRDQRADALGGPDRKRLELAKALAMQPKLLLLDEVMAGLTATEVAEALAMLQRVQAARQLTIIIIEHVMRVLMRLCDRIVVLHHGEKIAEGAPAAIAQDPLVIDAYFGSRRP